VALPTTAQVRSDFDRLAQLDALGWNHNVLYHSFLLDQLPRPCRAALEIGCGTGAFSRALAARCERVVALDLSPEMIRLARDRKPPLANVRFELADACAWTFPVEQLDCITSIATLHHLDPRALLPSLRAALRTGGVLLVLDLVADESLLDRACSALALVVSAGIRLLRTGRLREPRAVREAWEAHGRTETYLRLSEVQELCRELLPGARVRRHLLWRYSIVWKKPDDRVGGVGR
jgi:SAM-dependent methyltransferase